MPEGFAPPTVTLETDAVREAVAAMHRACDELEDIIYDNNEEAHKAFAVCDDLKQAVRGVECSAWR